ncbi:MBL fold metallo-hydrolase [Alkalibacter mobilis]|uniref:MBL fold metallo-hydrolase n=1 Tax=Alkalibacter mobilis TaxID=2787712 RepID=UPI00189CBD96|nr:MBL fold metallo-hydrolase [Alkalibacter mobilis]MBF7096196.1 MBL fold metallo-hydrolase [Alkalibacter mobilis]
MMVSILSENVSLDEKFGCEHGLSIHVNLNDKEILFDTGASDVFAKNAKVLDLDLSKVDHLILSHGHYDHGGGLKHFLELNNKAKIYARPGVFDDFVSVDEDGNTRSIGLNKNLNYGDRIVYTDKEFQLDFDIELFTVESRKDCMPLGNKRLFVNKEGRLILDDFKHEQNMVIREGGKAVLFCGCAHNGIMHIVKTYRDKFGSYPDAIVGGFHFGSRSQGSTLDEKFIDQTAEFLIETKAECYTGHCTGVKGYKILKSKMGDKVRYMFSGLQFKV